MQNIKVRTIYARISDIKAGIDEDGVTLGNYSGKMAELGFNVLDANGNLRDMGEVIEEIGGKWGTLTREQQVYLTQTMAGQRQYNNLLALFDNFEQYNKELLIAQEAEGTLSKQQEIRMDSMDAHLKILKASMEDIYNSLADSKSLNSFIDGLSSAATFFARFVDSIGGGAGALRLLGTIGFNVFSEQIAKSINTTINNLQAGRQNAAQFDMQLKNLSQFKGISGLDKMSTDILKSREQLLQLSKSMTPEQFSGMQSLLHNIEETANQMTLLNQQYESLQKLVNLVSKKKVFDIPVEERQKIQDNIQGFTNLSENIEKVKRNIASLAPETTKTFSEARSSVDDFITKLNTLNEKGFLNGHQVELQNIMQQYNQLPASINTEEAKQKLVAMFDSLIALAQKAEGPLKSIFEQLLAEFSSGELEGAIQKTKDDMRRLTEEFVNGQERIKKAQSIQNWGKMASGLASVGTSIQQIQRLGSIWKNSDLSGGQKVLQTVTNLAIALPMLISGFHRMTTAMGLLRLSTVSQVTEMNRGVAVDFKRVGSLKILQTQAGKTAIAIKGMGESVALINPVTGILTAIGIIGTIYSMIRGFQNDAEQQAKENEKEALQKQNEREKKIQEEVDNNKKLYSSLRDLNEQFENHEITRGELKSAVEDLIQQYGLQAEAADTLRDSYRNLDDYLQEHTIKELRRQKESAQRQAENKKTLLENGFVEKQPEHNDIFQDLWDVPSNDIYAIAEYYTPGTGRHVDNPYSEFYESFTKDQLRQYKKIFKPLKRSGFSENSEESYNFLGTKANDFNGLLTFYEEVGESINELEELLSEDQLKQDPYYNKLLKWYNNITPLIQDYTNATKQAVEAQTQLTALEAESAGIINFNNSNIQSAIDFANEREKLIEQQKALLVERGDTESDPIALADAYLTEYHGTLSQKYLETSKVISSFREQISDDNKEIQKEVENIISKLDEKHLDAFVDLDLSTVDNWQRLLEILNQISNLNFDYDSSRLKLGPESLQEDASAQYQIYASLEQQVRGGKTISPKELQKLDPQLQSYFSMMANGSYKMTKDAQTFYNKVNNLKLGGFFDTIGAIEQETQRLQRLQQQSDMVYKEKGDLFVQGIVPSMPTIPSRDLLSDGSELEKQVQKTFSSLNYSLIQEQLTFLEAITDKNSKDNIKIDEWQRVFSKGITGDQSDEEMKKLIASAHEVQDAFEDAQDAARKDLEDSPARLRELAKMTEQINHQIHDAMFPTDADVDEGVLASLTGTIQQIADESDDLADSLTEDARAAEDISEAVLRFDDAINDVVENYDEWLAALNSGNIQQQAEIIDKLRDAYGDLLDIDGSVLSTDFLTNTENLNLMKAAIDGDIDAYNQLVNLSGQDIAVQLGVDLSTFYADRDAIQASIQEFTGQDFDDIEIGAKLNDQGFLNGLTDLVNAANMTAQQATAYLADMGVNAEVVQHSTEAEQQSEDVAWSSEVTPHQVPANDQVLSMQGPFPAPLPIQQRITEWNQEVTARPVPGKAIKRNKAFSLKVTSANKSSGGEFKFSQAKNGAGSKGAARRSPTTSSKGSGGGRSGGSGTKAASPDTSKKDTKKAMEDTRDIYHDINIEIEQLNRRLDRVQKQQDRLYGKQLLDNLNRQSKILEKQKDLLKEKQELQKQDLAAQQETLKNLGITFDKYGNITDYMSLLGSRQAEINALTNQYNGLIEAYNQSTDKDVKKSIADQAEALNKRIKAAEDEYKDLEKKIKDYDGLRKDMEDLVDEMEEITQKQIELNIEKFNMEVKIRLDMGEAERDWNQFRRDVLEHTDLMKDSDFSKNFKDALQNSRNLSSYFYVGGSKGSLQTLTEQLLATRKEIEDINKIGTSAIYGDNKAKAMQDLQNNLNELMKQMGEVKSLIDQIDESYFDTIEKINEEFEKQIEDYEYVGELIEHDMDLLTLLYGQKNYEAMDNYYSTLEKNNLKQLDSLKRQREFWKQQWEAAVARGDTQAAKQFEQNYKNTIKNLNQLIEDSAKTLQDKYSNAINKIFNDLDKKLTNGHGLDYLGMEWDLMNKNADEYLDTINSAFAVQETQRKYQKAIDDTKSIKNQQALKKLMDQQLGILKDKEKITQYDVDRAEKLLQVEQARIALEEAQSAKTSMRLKRDSQGNYSYEYVADDDAIGEAQDNLAKAQNDLYNFDKERYYNNLKDIYDMTKEFEQKYKEIILDASLTEQEKIEQLALLREQYAEYINDKTAQNLVVRQNLMDSAFNDMAALYQTDVANYNQMSTDEKNILMGDLVPAWDSGIQQMADKVAGEGGFIPACQEAFQNVDNATQDYRKDLDELATAAGIDLNDVKNGVDDLALEFEDLIEKNDSLVDRMGLEMGAIQSLRNQAQQLVQDYNGVFDAAKNAVSQLHQFVEAEQAAAAAYARTATAYEEMVNRIQTANASYAANPYGSTAINYQSSSGDGGSSSSGSGSDGSSSSGGSDGTGISPSSAATTATIKRKKKNFSGCFSAGTKIIMADKTIKNIEDVKINDIVIAFNDQTEKYEPRKVTKTFIHPNATDLVEILLSNGITMSMTPGHPILTPEGWKSLDIENSLYEHGVEAQLLQIHNKVLGFYEEDVYVEKITFINVPNNYTVYNLQVEYCHTFLANGIVVHNAKAMGAYATGGYTGDWNSNEGRLAILHEKELVLNKEDTENFLNSLNLLDRITARFGGNMSQRIGNISAKILYNSSDNKDSLEQNVHIEASFPNVDSKREIEEAFDDLVNLAAQRAMRK